MFLFFLQVHCMCVIRYVGIQSLESISWEEVLSALDKICIMFTSQNSPKTGCHFKLTKELIFNEESCFHNPKTKLQNKVSHQKNCSIMILSSNRMLCLFFMANETLGYRRFVAPKARSELELAQGALRTSCAHLFPTLSLSDAVFFDSLKSNGI